MCTYNQSVTGIKQSIIQKNKENTWKERGKEIHFKDQIYIRWKIISVSTQKQQEETLNNRKGDKFPKKYVKQIEDSRQ